MQYRSGLNQHRPLLTALMAALQGASGCEVAVAYAKVSGVAGILAHLPARTRAVIGLGFGLTDPDALDLLASDVDVRVVVDSASRFHPKLYLAHRPSEVVVFSGSANLTAGGLRDNSEQYEELRFPANSSHADDQRARFEALWKLGLPLAAAKKTPGWARYLALVDARRDYERQQRRIRRHPPRARPRARNRLPGYIGLTAASWWDHQRDARYADGAVFMRSAASGQFRRLESGGLFFHLVTRSRKSEDARAIEGFSEYHDASK